MADAAYKKKVQVSVNGTSNWKDVPCTAPSLDLSGEVLDDTTLANSASGYRSRMLGIQDWSVSCDSNYTTGNDALDMIRNAKITRGNLHVRYLPQGTVSGGFQGPVVVESYNLSGDVGGLETVSITLQANGALANAS
jgi:predicted secreted protein